MDTETFVHTTLADMPIDTETEFGLSRYGRTITFRIRRTADGFCEQNDLYGMDAGAFGLPFDLDGMIDEINSILDK